MWCVHSWIKMNHLFQSCLWICLAFFFFASLCVCSTTITWVCQVDSIIPWIFMNELDISPASCLCQWLMQQREGSVHGQMTTKGVFRPYIYRRPCALEVQAKTNIVLIKLNYDSGEQIWWVRCWITDGGKKLDLKTQEFWMWTKDTLELLFHQIQELAYHSDWWI